MGKKRKKDSPPPPPDPETDDSASGTEETGAEADTNGNGDAEEDNIRLTKSAVHNEYLQTSETVEVKNKNGKKIKVTKWESACKHCPMSQGLRAQEALGSEETPDDQAP